MEGMRGRRVAETIKHHLTSALTREVQDRRLAHLVVTAVDVPDDLGVARVFVRLLVGDDDKAARRSTLQALARVSGRLRRSLAPRLRLKRVPELKFFYDTGLDHSRRVDELLREIAAEEASRTADPSDD
jgi:ribosome-binding factor A